ncbi:MAG: BTAD domain-containing putative transcriptional regulator [Acidobacteriota bacterium]
MNPERLSHTQRDVQRDAQRPSGLEPWIERLSDRLRRLPGPVIQIWGWPGAGQRRLLRHLAQLGAREIPPAALESPEELMATVAEAWRQGLPYVLCRRFPRPLLGEEGARRLEGLMLEPPLVVATDSPVDFGDEEEGSALLDPWELLLTEREMEQLWWSETGDHLSSTALENLGYVTEGWLELVRLAIRAGDARGLTVESLASQPAVESFLQQRVLPSLGRELVSTLQRVLDEGGEGDLRAALVAIGGDAAWQRLAHRHGLVLAGSRGSRLPRVLASSLRSRSAVQREVPSPSTAPGAESTDSSSSWQGADAAAAHETVAAFELRLLGPPSLTRVDVDPPQQVSWTLRRSLLLLTFLSLSPGRRASRDEVAEAIFPGEDPEIIRKNFHPTLSHLRRNLGAGRGASWSGIEFANGTYRLDPRARWTLDIERFEALVAEGRSAFQAFPRADPEQQAEPQHSEEAANAVLDPLRQAWALYAGPFLPGVDALWARRRRESLHRTYLDLLKILASAADTLHQPTLALDAWRAYLLEDPLEESIHVSLMTHYAHRGRRDLVRRQYQRLTSLLQSDLGVGPLPETTRAYHRLIS